MTAAPPVHPILEGVVARVAPLWIELIEAAQLDRDGARLLRLDRAAAQPATVTHAAPPVCHLD
jgi:hypothetical protein